MEARQHGHAALVPCGRRSAPLLPGRVAADRVAGMLVPGCGVAPLPNAVPAGHAAAPHGLRRDGGPWPAQPSSPPPPSSTAPPGPRDLTGPAASSHPPRCAEVLGVDALRAERVVSCGADRTCRVWKIPEESQLIFRCGTGCL